MIISVLWFGLSSMLFEAKTAIENHTTAIT
jgi:hypothetical protein